MQVSNLGGWSLVRGQDRTSKTLGQTSRSLRKVLERLSTAQRINRASDDAAGLGVSEMLRTQTRGFKMATRNVEDALSALRIAEGTANETSSMLQRQRELAIQAGSDTLTDDQRAALDVEYQQITQEIDRAANASEYNRQDVATDQGLASGNAQIQVGPNAGDQVSLPSNDMTADSLGITNSSIATRDQAQQALGTLDSAIDQLNTQRSGVGAMMNRFESTRNNLSIADINTQAAESVLRDEDMAQGLADLVRFRLLRDSGTAAFSRFGQISENHILGLLQGI